MPEQSQGTAISREEADLYAGGTGLPAGLSDEQFTKYAQACEASLLALLCRKSGVLDTDPQYQSWLMLLAAWIKATYAVSRAGVERVTSKSVRNFSVSYGNDGRVVLADFYDNQSQLIGMFSQCGAGVEFQSDRVPLIYGPDSLELGGLLPDAPPLLGGSV